MPVYEYHAKRGPTDVVDGAISAPTRPAAVAHLTQQGLSPMWIREQLAGEGATAPVVVPATHGIHVRSRDINAFTRQLASLLRSGVPILKGLMTIREQTDDQRMGAVVGNLERDIRDGRMLSEAMQRYPRVFSPFYINMVRSGEAAGVLDEILMRLAQAQDEEEEMRAKVQSALAYPLLVLAAGAVSVFVMLTFFMPRIARIFDNSSLSLPWPTRILIALGDFFGNYWGWTMVPLIVILVILRRMLRVERGRMTIDRMVLRLPVAGRLLRDADLARFARTLSLLVRTGIPIHHALDLSCGTMHNAVLRAEIGRVSTGTVQQGASLAAGMRQLIHVPMFVANMVAVGEASGRLEDALDEIARYYGRELERSIKLITALLEPVLILVVGAIVGFIVFATLLPIFQIGRTLG